MTQKPRSLQEGALLKEFSGYGPTLLSTTVASSKAPVSANPPPTQTKRVSVVSSYLSTLNDGDILPGVQYTHDEQGAVEDAVLQEKSAPIESLNFFYEAHKSLIAPPQESQRGENSLASLAERHFYSYRYPQSFYGPYGEAIVKAGNAAFLNNASFGRTAAFPEGVLLDGMSNLSMTGSNFSSTMQTSNISVDERSLKDLCSASLGSYRNFADEWSALLRMKVQSLSQMSARMHALDKLASEFAHAMSPIAAKIVEDRNQVPSHRQYRSLPRMDDTYIVHGCIFVVTSSHFRKELYGSRDAVARACNNEIRALRSLMGAPHLTLSVPLCTAVQFMGIVVFVSCPYWLSKNVQDHLVYGSLDGSKFRSYGYATQNAYKMSEFIPLQPHLAPDEKTKLFTASSVKQFYCNEDGSTWIMDAARLFPPAVCRSEQSRIHAKDDSYASKLPSRHPLEDEPNAHLSVLFRPEFMRTTCTVQLNPDGGIPSQPPQSQENIAYSIHTVMTTLVQQVVSELITQCKHNTLQQKHIPGIMHRFGVNLRYLGRVYYETEALNSSKYHEKTQVMRMIAIEGCCRAFKSVLFDELANEGTFHHEELIVVTRMRQFLMASPNSLTEFWEAHLKPVMNLKFGFYVCPATIAGEDDLNADRLALKMDPNNLQVYRALNNNRKRFEKAPQLYKWIDIGGNEVVLDKEAAQKAAHMSESSVSALFPLLGPNAKENVELMNRIQELAAFNLVCDLRGKRVVVQFKPKAKSLTCLRLSPSVNAMFENGPKDLSSVLGLKRDPIQLCDVVESAARQEIQSIARISENDPRATLPLQLLGTSYTASGNHQQAYATFVRWTEIRKMIPNDIISGSSFLEVAPLFISCGRLDRGESLIVEGLRALRIEEAVVPFAFIVNVFNSTLQIRDALFLEQNRLSGERIMRILEYLYYTAYVAGELRLSILPSVLEEIGITWKKFTSQLQCARCSSSVTVAATRLDSGSDGNADRINDQGSHVGSRTGTSTTNAPRKVPPRRRGREEQKKEEEDPAEMFTKYTLAELSAVLLVGLPAGGLTQDMRVPSPPMLGDILTPDLANKPGRFFCTTCAEGVSGVKHVIASHIATLFTRTVKLLRASPVSRAVGSSSLGDCLVSLGVLQTDPSLVQSGIKELSSMFGPDSHQAMKGELQLAEVLISKSNTAVVYDQPTRDIDCLCQAEEVLRSTLNTILKRPSDFLQKYGWELASVVSNLQNIATLYSGSPVAKKEHNAMHYLVDNLIPHLPASHPLVGSILGKITSYYIRLAKEKRERNFPQSKQDRASGASSLTQSQRHGASTSLLTAGDYACQWLRCCLQGDDPLLSSDIESHITVIRDDIITVLRNEGPSERQQGLDLCRRVQSLVAGSAFSDNQSVKASLDQMMRVLETQSTNTDQTENIPRLVRQLDGIKVEMKRCVKNISQHRNRQDGYGKMQLKRISQLKQEAKAISDRRKHPDLESRVHDISLLHDELLKIKHNVEDEGAGGEDTSSHQVNSHHLNKTYESPYNFLGMSEQIGSIDSLQSSPSAARRGSKVLSPQTTSLGVSNRSASGARTTSIFNSTRGPQGGPVMSTGSQMYLADLERSGKKRETVQRLTKVLPRITNSMAPRSFNPLLNLDGPGRAAK